MASIREMSPKVVMLIALAIVAGVVAAGYFLVLQEMSAKNDTQRATLQAKQDENNKLREYEPRLADLERQIASLKQQLEIQKQIVPDSKEADRFITMMQEAAAAAGIEVRRFTARGVNTRDFYAEVPFEIEVDGTFYSMLNFFERISKLERIVNISNLQLASVSNTQAAKTKKKYQYAPGESVVATAVATTFFSNETTMQAAPPPAKGPGARPGPPAGRPGMPPAAPAGGR
jgi:type IV pilus assembly protein PilO